MKDYRAAIRYARALFALAEERNLIEFIEKELTEATELVKHHPEISHLLANATVSQEEKEDFLEKIFPSTSSPLFLNFLKVLVRKKRFRDLSIIQESFHRLYEVKKGLQKVRVQAPLPLDSRLESQLILALEKKLKRKVYLEVTVDPEILGGLILDLDGTQIDGSYRTFLHELKQRILTPYAQT